MGNAESKKFRSVMVIDDNQMDLYVAELMLIKSGLAENIIVHGDAAKALHEIKLAAGRFNELPELILLDINMPSVNGFDFLGQFDLLPEHIKDLVFIFMLTSSIHNDDRATAISYPYVRGIINKPLTLESIREIERVL